MPFFPTAAIAASMSPARSSTHWPRTRTSGCLRRASAAELGEIESIVAERDLPTDVAQAVQPDGGGRRSGGGAGLGLEAEAQPGPGRAPPRRREDPEAGLFEDRRPIAEEREHAGGVGHLLRGRRRGQRGAERRDEPGRESEAAQEQLVGVRDVPLQRRELGAVGPHRRGGDEQAGVVDRLERELDPPVVGSGGLGREPGILALALVVAGGGGLDTEAGAHRLGGRVRRGMPGPQRPGERFTLGGGYVDVVAVDRTGSAARHGQGGHPGFDGTGSRGRLPATTYWLGGRPIGQKASRQRVRHAPHVGAHDVGRCWGVRHRSGPLALVGHAGTREGRRKVPGQGLDAPTVVAVHQRTPHGPTAGGGELQIGQDAAPGNQLEDQVSGSRGESEVRSEGDIRLPRDHGTPRVRGGEGESQTRRVTRFEDKPRRRPLRRGLGRLR